MNSTPDEPTQYQSTFALVALVATMMALNAFAIDMMLPALGIIGDELNAFNDNARQLVIIVYLIANGIGQLFVGPITDRFGRRTVLIWSLIGYCAGCVLSILAQTFFTLLAARVFQGVATAAARVAALAAVRDQTSGRHMAEIMSLAITVFMAAPIIAPGLGQAVLFFVPWRGIFVALLAYGAILLVWVYICQPETHKKEDHQRLEVDKVASAYWTFLSNRISFGYTMASALCFAAVFGYISSSEQIFLDTYDLGARFPLVFALTAASLAAASMFNARFVKKFGMRRITHSALLAFVVFNTLHLIANFMLGENLMIFISFMLISFFCSGLIVANATTLALEPMGEIAGLAAGVNGFFGTALAGIIGGTVGFFYNGTTTPITIGFFVLSFIALVLVIWTENGVLAKPYGRLP